MNCIRKILSLVVLSFYAINSMSQQELIIPDGGGSIYGVTSPPSTLRKGQKRGVAIVCHGFNGTHHFGKDYFRTLNELGYMVYTFDFPCGSVYSRSDNNTMNMSIIDEKESLKNIVQFFRKQKDIDKHNIILIAESQGGLVSALAASELKRQIRALVLIYPAFCIPDNWNDRYPTVESIPDTTRVWNVPVGRRFFLETRNMHPYELISTYTGPVLIVHGDKDNIVPLSYSEKLVGIYKCATLKVIPDAGHGFSSEQRKVSNRFVHEFLTDLIEK